MPTALERNCSDSSSNEEHLLIPNGSLPVESEKEKKREKPLGTPDKRRTQQDTFGY